MCCRDAIKSLTLLTKKEFHSIHIVGGGCRDTYLNELTAKKTGLPVLVGPVEGTVIGNLMLQMIAAKQIKDLAAGRQCIVP